MKRIAALILCLLLICGAALAETVDVFGQAVPKDATTLDLTGVKYGSVKKLCAVLDQLPNLEQVDMWEPRVVRDDRVYLHNRYPNIRFGWDIYINKTHQVRSDATAFSTLSKGPMLYKYQLVDFTHCYQLKALDLGHNQFYDISFLRDCPPLKILILAQCRVKDLSPLENQTELEYLELFINDITDISPLANMKNLRDVNLAYNNITDLSPLYDLPNLERVWLMMNPNLSDEEVERLRQYQPDCEIVTYSWGATGNRMKKVNGQLIQTDGTSWRDHPHYDTISYIFNSRNYIGWDDPIPEGWQALADAYK